MKQFLLILTAFGILASCETMGPLVQGESAVTVAGQDLQSLAQQAADAYIKVKGGNADYAWSIASGLRAYQTLVRTPGDFKAIVAQFSEGRKAGLTFAQALANLFASSPAPAPVKAAVIAKAVEKAAAQSP